MLTQISKNKIDCCDYSPWKWKKSTRKSDFLTSYCKRQDGILSLDMYLLVKKLIYNH